MDASFCDTRDLADMIKLRILGFEMVLGHPGGPRVITRTHGEAEEVSRGGRGVEVEAAASCCLEDAGGVPAQQSSARPRTSPGKDPPSDSSEPGWPCSILIWVSGLQNCEKTTKLVLGLRLVVAVALRQQWRSGTLPL